MNATYIVPPKVTVFGHVIHFSEIILLIMTFCVLIFSWFRVYVFWRKNYRDLVGAPNLTR